MSATIENFPTLPIMTFSKFFFLFFNEKQRQFLEETYIFNSSRCHFCLIRPHFDRPNRLSTLSELILNSEAGLLFTCKLKTDTDFLGRAKLEVTAAPASKDTGCLGKIVFFHNSLQPLPRLHRCKSSERNASVQSLLLAGNFLYNQ